MGAAYPKDYRIALIAMSGVRVKDHELLKLGMTLPGFVERSEVIASLPSLSLLTLAAHTPPNWHPTYLEIDQLGESAVEHIVEGRFDLVAITSFTARIDDAYALSDRLRSVGVCVVMGGLHVSAMPHEALEYADSIVEGEGERIWPRLLRDFERGELRPRYSSRDSTEFVVELTHAPVPRYDLLDLSRYNRLTLQTSRGCPHHCSFCAASRTISRYKRKDIAQVERELDAIYALWPRPFIELADDNTFVHKSWSKDLLRAFRKRPMKWFTETDLSVADDPELLELLAESNCAQVLIGLESAIPESLQGLDRNDWKRAQFERYHEKIERIQSYGVSVNGCFILGLDSDDESCFETTERFIRESVLSEVQITVLTPFPGTDLYRALKEEGRLLRERFWDECTLFDVTYRPRRMSAAALRSGFQGLMRAVYSDQAVARRRARFRACRGERRKILAEHKVRE